MSFEAERSQIKRNNLGTQVLVLTRTDVDITEKRYYGQSGLYLLRAAGNFDRRVPLDKDDFFSCPGYAFRPAVARLRHLFL